MLQNQDGVKRDVKVLLFSGLGLDVLLLVLPTFVLDVAADRVDDVERTVRAEITDDCEGDVLRRLIFPVIEEPRILERCLSLSVSVSPRDSEAAGNVAELSLGLSCIVANRLHSAPRLDSDRLRPPPPSILNELDEAVDKNDAIEFRFVCGTVLKGKFGGGSL